MLQTCQGMQTLIVATSYGVLTQSRRFGGSYDPETDPTSTTYYVDVFMGLFRHLKLPKFHLIGHHAGSSMAMELASVYPDEVFTCCLSAPAMATAEEQAKMFKALANEWSKPKPDGSHLMAVWNLMNGVLWTDLDIKNHEVIDTLRAWKGRDQAYACTFKQDKLTLYKSIPKSVPLLAMCSKDDVLWPCFHYCKELVRPKSFMSLRFSANLTITQQPEARFEVTGPGNFINATHEQVGSIAYFHFDFLEKMGA